MFDAILFDLDGTLVENDMKKFVSQYFQTLEPRIKQYCPDEDYVRTVMRANQPMLTAKRSIDSLLHLFLQEFARLTGLRQERINTIFNEYYENEYKNIQVVKPVRYARECLQAAAHLTRNMVIATLPIFPVRAIQQRLEWGNIADFDYRLVTGCEVMHTSKPHVEYFMEIAEILGCDPSRCLMAGNDHIDDLAAKQAGMQTYLVTNFQVNKGKGSHSPDYSGDMKELMQFLQQRAIE